MELNLAGLTELFLYSASMWWVIIPAVLIGLVMGAIPGFAAHNTIIMLLPLTLMLEPGVALAFMVALYCASHMGGGVPAILLNIPGTGGAAATTFDGYPMSQNGQAARALALSFVASILAGLVTSAVTLFMLPWLSQVGFYIRSVEMVIVMLFGLGLIAAIAAQDMLKGLIAGAFGLMLGAMGADHIFATPRGTFGILELFDGVPLVPALIGLFAISEALIMLENRRVATGEARNVMPDWAGTVRNILDAFRHWFLTLWAGLLGLIIGVLPGAGASIAAFVAYQQARAFSKTPEKFGTGHEQGVVAPEAANNSAAQTAFVPTLSLGIPGDAIVAVMLGALILHGVTPGPRLITDQPELFWGLTVSFLIGNLLLLVLNLPLIGVWVRILSIPYGILYPAILVFICIGVYSINNSMFDVTVAILCGVVGYAMRLMRFSPAPLLLGLVLGPLLEQNLRRSLLLSRGDPMIFFERPISASILALAALLVAVMLAASLRRRRQARA